MCGIIGIINKRWDSNLSVQTENILRQLLYANGVRGMDGTGLFKIKKDHTTETIKKAIPVYDFLSKHETKNFIDTYFKDSFAVIGHNRKATIGGISDEKSHPFKEDKITLVHNGTLNDYNKNDEIHSDSHHIAVELNNTKQTEKETLENLFGAYALVWHNKEKQQINLCRNKQRPLAICETKDLLVIASEWQMAEWILNRNGIEVIKTIELEENYLYKYSFKNKLNLTKIKFKEKTVSNKTANKIWNKWNTTQIKPIDDDDDNDDYISNTSKYSSYFQKEDEKLIVIPDKVERIVTTFGGYAPYAGVGTREERFQFTGKIIYPEKLSKHTFITSIKETDIKTSLLQKECTASYYYKQDKTCIRVNNLELKFPEKENTLSEQTTWKIKTKNNFVINQNNIEEIYECKCSSCKEDFNFHTAEQSYIYPKTSKLQGQDFTYGYEYLCDKCVIKNYKTRYPNFNQKKIEVIEPAYLLNYRH